MKFVEAKDLNLVTARGPDGYTVSHTFIDSTRPIPRGETLIAEVDSTANVEAAKAKLRTKLAGLIAGNNRWCLIAGQTHLVDSTKACPGCGLPADSASDWLYFHPETDTYGIEKPRGMPARAEAFHPHCSTMALKRHEAAKQR